MDNKDEFKITVKEEVDPLKHKVRVYYVSGSSASGVSYYVYDSFIKDGILWLEEGDDCEYMGIPLSNVRSFTGVDPFALEDDYDDFSAFCVDDCENDCASECAEMCTCGCGERCGSKDGN